MSKLHGKNILGGELSAEGTSTFCGVDPASDAELEPRYTDATAAEVHRAFELATEAFAARRDKRPEELASFLERIADEIMAIGDTLIERAGAESGLPEARLQGERARTVNQIRMFAGVVREGSWLDATIDLPLPDRQPLPKPDLRRMLVPLGPVAVFGASNFPLAFSVAGGDTASALAAGCPVVAKAHPAHPGTSELVGGALRRAIEATGMPPGMFSLVHGASHEVGLAMVRHPLAKAVGFTGSLAGGRALFDAAAARSEPIPVFAEMGSVNPVFLLPAALAERGEAIATGMQQSVTLGVGQFCTNPGLIVGVEDDALSAFAAKLAAAIQGSAPGTMLHRGILAAYEDGVKRVEGVDGVTLAARSATAVDPAKTQAAACFFATDAATFLRDRRLSQEVFGPSTILVRCESREKLEAIAAGLEGHLTATIHGTEADLEAHRSLVTILESKVGRLLFNGFPTGVEVCDATHHGGPYPATTDGRFTSVGTAAIRRFARPICYQSFPQAALPAALRNDNPLGIWRVIDGERTRDPVE